jgi:glycosyltransferase involved in cell wall biosynthesis
VISINKVFLVTSGYKHSLYNSLVDHPPKNCEVFYHKKGINKRIENIHKKSYVSKTLKNYQIPFLPLNLIKSSLMNIDKREDFDTLFCSGLVPFTKSNWVADCEYASQFAGYNKFNLRVYRRVIQKRFAKDNCLSIFSWTEKGVNTLRKFFPEKSVTKKTNFLPIAQLPSNNPSKEVNNNVIFTFISSINLPFDYRIKGGEIAIESFNRLCKKFDNVKLIFRSYIPEKLKQKYSSNKNIEFINENLPFDQYQEILNRSDVLLFPSFNTPGVIFIEMMKYGIPTITSNVWANEEMIQHNHNGLILQDKIYSKMEDNDGFPLWDDYSNYYDRKIIDNLSMKYCDLMSKYADDPKLIRIHGEEGKKKLSKNGRYSIKTRNDILSRAFHDG